jgi:hypothetical protein
MALIEEHMSDCVKFMGKPFRFVHEWMDEYARTFHVGFFDEYHRTFRHNSYGLDCIYGMWGPDAEEAAIIHLIRDYIRHPITAEEYDKFLYSEIHFNKMMNHYNNPPDLKMHFSVIEAWIKEGFGLVSLATRSIVNIES